MREQLEGWRDPVETWKSLARARIASRPAPRRLAPLIRHLCFAAGVASMTLLGRSSGGAAGALVIPLVLVLSGTLSWAVIGHVQDRRARRNTAAAWAAIGKDDPFLAHRALSALPASSIEPHLIAAYLSTCNRVGESVALLEDMRGAGARSMQATKLLVDLRLRQRESALALAIAREDASLLTEAELSAVEAAATALERCGEASRSRGRNPRTREIAR